MSQESKTSGVRGFKGSWILMVPEADPQKHRASIKTPKYEAVVVCVKDCDQAVAVCKSLVEKEAVDSVTLCPAFTNFDVAKVIAVIPKTPVNVCRSDGPSMFAEYATMKKIGWFEKP
ncbi:MAG: hypothetical protein A2Y91_07815 [Chloroflexi bacterium RBG_13_54_8]|nr:MAG: hypothetical protein A2Y91_07815 [Chloroflexi bacterium RBG_13_54_8]